MISDAAYTEIYEFRELLYTKYYESGCSDVIRYETETGGVNECVYYYYFPRDTELDASTPVVAWVTHGGGVEEIERATVLNTAAGQDTRAIVIVPWTDKPRGICAALDAAKRDFEGKGRFDEVSGQGTSSAGRAIIRAALESVREEAGYSFRFGNVLAYDPTEESFVTNISGQTGAMKRLAGQGMVLAIQTDSDERGGRGGSGRYCNKYARLYSEAGGTAIIAEINYGDHEAKFLKPIRHNSIGWAAGCGMLAEDVYYKNAWYCYRDGEKIPCTLEEATALLHPARDAPTARRPLCRLPRSR